MTVRRHGPLTPAAQLQQRLWDADSEGWAELAEPHNEPLFAALLDAAAVRPGTRLLDIGCGSGLLMCLAAGHGAVVTGVDVAPGLLDVAAGRLPAADLWLADMQQLPFADAARPRRQPPPAAGAGCGRTPPPSRHAPQGARRCQGRPHQRR